MNYEYLKRRTDAKAPHLPPPPVSWASDRPTQRTRRKKKLLLVFLSSSSSILPLYVSLQSLAYVCLLLYTSVYFISFSSSTPLTGIWVSASSSLLFSVALYCCCCFCSGWPRNLIIVPPRWSVAVRDSWWWWWRCAYCVVRETIKMVNSNGDFVRELAKSDETKLSF